MGAAGDRDLVFAREVGELLGAGEAITNREDVGRGVEILGEVDAGGGAAEHVARHVAAGLKRRDPDRGERLPDLGHVLNVDVVELEVLAIGDVDDAPAPAPRDLGAYIQLVGAELAGGRPDAHHEHLVFLGALRVYAVPAEAPAEVGGVDRVPAVDGVIVDDPVVDVEAILVALVLLLRGQRLAIAHLPLALRALRPRHLQRRLQVLLLGLRQGAGYRHGRAVDFVSHRPCPASTTRQSRRAR